MTKRSIAHQLLIIRQATAKALVSQETAADFLKRAGLSKKEGPTKILQNRFRHRF
jgi:hypothetical protein